MTVEPPGKAVAGSTETAVSCPTAPGGNISETLPPAASTVPPAGPTVGSTSIVAAALLPSESAVILADPGSTPVTRPFPETVATTELLVDQFTVRSCRDLPSTAY